MESRGKAQSLEKVPGVFRDDPEDRDKEDLLMRGSINVPPMVDRGDR